MWQLITKFGLQNILKFAGAWLLAHGFATSDQWTALAGGVMAVAGMISHWHDAHAQAQASGQVPAPVTPANVPIKTIASALALCFAIFWTAGCGTTPQKIAYRSAGSTVVTVDAAMSEWGAYVAANHPGTNEEAQVKDAYDKYQAAMAAVCDAGTVYASANQTNTPAASAALQTAIGNANNEIEDLEVLISRYGVQLH